MSRYSLFFVLVLTMLSCGPVQLTQEPTGTAVVLTSTLEPTSTSVPLTPTLTPEELLKTHPEIVAVEQYGMPEDMADKLVGLSVSFEVITKNVDGVLVNDQETGTDLFYFDNQTEFLVAVDRWPIITSVDRIRENEMTEEELFSDEYFAWLKYVASKLEFDSKKINNNIEMDYVSFVKFLMLAYDVQTAPNFDTGETKESAPFRHREALGYLNFGEKVEGSSEPFGIYASLPTFYLVQEESGWRVYPVISTSWSLDENQLNKQLNIWVNGMNITLVVVTDPIDGYPSSYPNNLVDKTYQRYGDDYLEEGYESLKNGDPSLLSQPGLVVDGMIVDDHHYR